MKQIGTTQLAMQRAGFRERYAMVHGTRQTKTINGHKCWVFTYSDADPYQDGNGATYNITLGRWTD